MTKRTHRILLGLILAIYLLLALGYGIATPLFETPDEHLHFFTVEYIANEGRLPTTADAGLMGQEAAQPPLYYALGAALVNFIDTSGAERMLWANPLTDTSAVAGQQLWLNPRANPGDLRGESLADPPININMFVETEEHAWPWQGYVLAAHILRIMSAFLGLGTLLAIDASARLVWPEQRERALLATALVAFLPQFGFIQGAITNDTAITLFAALGIWQLLRLRLEPPTTGRYLLLGVTIGLAMLSKMAGLLLLFYAGGVLGLQALLTADRQRLWQAIRAGALVAGPALLIGGWLLWRNWSLYGDPTAANQFVAIAGGRPDGYTWAQLWHDMDRVWFSFFAIFGWMNLEPPRWIHVIWTGIVLAAVGGGVWWGVRWLRARSASRSESSLSDRFFAFLLHPATILLGWFLLVSAGWLRFMFQTSADQGRLFFPALVSLALGAAFGLSQWPRPWFQRVVVGLALVTTVFSVLVVIPRSYAPPESVVDLPADALPVNHTFPNGLELLAARVDTDVARPNDWVWVTTYWRRPDGVSPGAPLAELELFGRNFDRIGVLRAYHGRGIYPAFLWPAGQLIEDQLAVRVVDWAEGPVQGNLTVKLDEDGEGVNIGALKVVPSAWPDGAESPLAALGDAVTLASAALSPDTAAPGDAVSVEIDWQVDATPGDQLLHAFVHLGDPTQTPLAQSDGPAMGGQYPSFLWEAGERFGETITLSVPPDLPPGRYPVNLGLYDFATGQRLPVVVDGQPAPTSTYQVGWLTVE